MGDSVVENRASLIQGKCGISLLDMFPSKFSGSLPVAEVKKNNAILKEKLFADVRVQILKFMESPRYEEYLCTKIEEAVCFAEHDEIQIYLSKEDEPRLKSLTVKTGFPLKLSDESFIGGIKAIIPEKNILIDNSFEEGYQAAYREFKFDGGPAHE